MNRESKINLTVAMICIGFACSSIYFYWAGIILSLPNPFNSFLPDARGLFGDFYTPFDYWNRLHFLGIDYGLSYFPATYLFVDFLSFISNANPYLAIATYEILFIIFTYCFIYSYVKNSESRLISLQRVTALTFMSYPFLITLHTGNLEGIIFCLLAIFLDLYRRSKFNLSAIPLGIAIAMKLFPAIFLILLIEKGKHKAILLTVTSIVFFSTLPLVIFDGGFNSNIGDYIYRLKQSQKMYFDLMVFSGAGVHFGHSLINSAKILFDNFPQIENIITVYSGLSIFCLIGLIIFLCWYKLPLWKQVCLTVCAMCLLPYTSTDYKLMHMTLVLLLFFDAEPNRNRRIEYVYLILITAILIPKNYFYFNSNPLLNLNNVMNTSCMLALVFCIFLEALLDRNILQPVAHRLRGSLLKNDGGRNLPSDSTTN